jgi:cytochrome c oxidase subunit 4
MNETHSHTHAVHDSHAANHDANAPKLYAGILATLLVLTAITVGASYIQFGSGMANVIVALTIATIKASLVALFFMHLLHDKAMNGIILVASFIFLGIFLISCYTDSSSRWDIKPQNWNVAPTVTASPGAVAPPAPANPAEAHH